MAYLGVIFDFLRGWLQFFKNGMVLFRILRYQIWKIFLKMIKYLTFIRRLKFDGKELEKRVFFKYLWYKICLNMVYTAFDLTEQFFPLG